MAELIAALGGTIWTILSFVVALSIIVFVHEFGHYIVGRWSGIRAEVFSVGFGPRLAAWRDRRGTVWQVAALPLGGYVRFLGDANAASAGPGQAVDPALRRQTLTGAPLWARFATLLAGPVFNFILAAVIFTGFAMLRGAPVDDLRIGALPPAPPGVVNALQPGDQVVGIDGQPVENWRDLGALAEDLPPGPEHEWQVIRDGARISVTGPHPLPAAIGSVAPRSAAADAGIRPGGTIMAVDGQPVDRFTDLRPLVDAGQGAALALRIWYPGAGMRDVTVTPKHQDLPAAGGGYERRWLIGIGSASAITPATEAVGPLRALGMGVAQVWAIIAGSVEGLWAMITGQIGSCNLGGAISIAETTGQAASAGGGNFIWWIAVLSAAIGFLNLLPIPVLDGGHLMFYGYEAVTGRPPSERALNLLTALGMAAVMTLMIFGLTNDLFCP